jgi:hypothetical protein
MAVREKCLAVDFVSWTVGIDEWTTHRILFVGAPHCGCRLCQRSRGRMSRTSCERNSTIPAMLVKGCFRATDTPEAVVTWESRALEAADSRLSVTSNEKLCALRLPQITR